jgi:hypothetical protein
VPWLPFFQFPWRMQGPLGLLCALIAALVFAELSRRLGRPARHWLELALLLAVIANALPHLSDARPLEERQAVWAETRLDPEALQRGDNVATVRDDYLPRTASPRLWRTRRPDERGILVLDSRVGTHVLEQRGSRIQLRLDAPEATQIVFGRWFFPGWTLRVDGRPREISADSLGAIRAELPQGPSEVELRYRPPLLRRVGLVLSVLSLAVWITLAALDLRRAPEEAHRP